MHKILEVLYHEHDEIIKFISTIKAECVTILEWKTVDTTFFKNATHFIRTYCDCRHHKKEEELLFKAMTDELGKRAENLINYGMLIEHDLARQEVDLLDKSIEAYEADNSVENKLEIVAHAMGYYYLLERHALKENTAVYPFAERMLKPETFARLNSEVVEYERRYE